MLDSIYYMPLKHTLETHLMYDVIALPGAMAYDKLDIT